MIQAGAVGFFAGFVAAAGFVLTILGGILWLIDRRFDDPPELSAGKRLTKVGLMLLLGAAIVLTVILLTAE